MTLVTSPLVMRGKINALDAVRAIAIVAVIVYHLDIASVPGGFLGVDVFFVLSGYLISWILITEVTGRGGVNFRHFYEARARRLVPAFLGVVLALSIVASLLAPDTIPKFYSDLPFASTGTVNWWYVLNETSYFEETARPPLLQHTWSLAVETQFYLVWPIVVAFFARRAWIKGMRWFAAAAATGFASMSIALGLHIEQASALQASNFYFGTGSRSVGLLLGAALAAGWTPERLTSQVPPRARLFIDLVGLFSLASLVYLFCAVSEVTLHWFAWASPLASIATAFAVAALVHPANRIARVLCRRPMLWLGTRSYGLYLWHWPVFQLLRPGLDVAWPDAVTLLVRLTLTAGFAEASYRWLELPIRQRRNPFAPLLDSYRNPNTRRFVAASVTAILLYPALALSRDAYASASREQRGFIASLDADSHVSTEKNPPAAPNVGATHDSQSLPLGAAARLLTPQRRVLHSQNPAPTQPASPTSTTTTPAPTVTTNPEPSTVAPQTSESSSPSPSTPTTTPATDPATSPALALAKRQGVWVVGDSVLLGAVRELRSRMPVAKMDAKVGLQANVLLHTLLDNRDAVKSDIVIMNIGNNGTVRAKTLRKVLSALTDRTVVIVDARVPRRWQDANNALIAATVADFPNTRLVRWSEISAGKPSFFSHDGIHLTASGADRYVDAIVNALAAP